MGPEGHSCSALAPVGRDPSFVKGWSSPSHLRGGRVTDVEPLRSIEQTPRLLRLPAPAGVLGRAAEGNSLEERLQASVSSDCAESDLEPRKNVCNWSKDLKDSQTEKPQSSL